MPLYLNEDQAMLADTARDFIATEGAIGKELRTTRDSEDGFSRELWTQFGELGFPGLLVAEADGGLGLGHVEAGIVLEEIGRNLTPSPFLTTSVLAATALAHGSDEVRGRWLPGLISGEAIYAVALDERAKHDPARIETEATRSGNGFRLSGTKTFVVNGAAADMLVVVARTAGAGDDADGLTLFAVPADAGAMRQDAVRLVDGSIATHLTLDGVELPGDAVIGDIDGGRSVLDAMLAAGRTGASAEQVGVARGAMGMTVDYLKQRKQFGRIIGEFQALQHRAAQLYAEVEIAHAAVLKAQQLLDAGTMDAGVMVSVAKAKAGRAAQLAVQEGVQMHGGIGMTDEYDIGFYMKRDRALAEFMGDPNYHANRVAQLSGY